jgi:hypothetical protein
MSRYQVRIPDSLDLDSIFGRMALHCVEILRAWDLLDPTKMSPENLEQLKQHICKAIMPYVKTYKLCGLSNICTDHLQTTNYVPDDQINSAPSDTIHQLFIPESLDEFIEKMAESTRNHLSSRLTEKSADQTMSILCSVFRCVLGEHVFFNPVCGKTELCVCSVQAPKSPWWRRK